MSHARSLFLKRMLLSAILPALTGTPSAGKEHFLPVTSPAKPGSLAPALTIDPVPGNIVMTWLEQGGGRHVLKFSVFTDGAFSEPGEIARGRNWFANWADTPGIHIRRDGTWLAHWLEKSADSTYAYDIRLAHSADGGKSWSEPLTPHTDGTPTEHGFVSYFSTGRGRTGMLWLDGRHTLSAADGAHAHSGFMTLRATVLDADGKPGPDRLLDDRVCDCCPTTSANTALGPIVAYRDRSEDEIRDIAVIRKLREGWTRPRPVHDDGWEIAGCPVNGPSIVAHGMQVAVGWFTMAGGIPRVHLATSEDAGASFSEPLTLSPGSALGRVQLAKTRDGFVMGWMAEHDDDAHLRIARFSWAGMHKGDRVVAQIDRGRISGFPQIAVLEDRLLVAWTGAASDTEASNRTQIMTALVALPEKIE